MMSREYPCIHYKHDGVCAKYSANGDLSYCVQAPCPDETPSNADRIRSMSDEELAEFLSDFKDCAKDCLVGKGVKDCSGICATSETLRMWLQQPEEEET